MPRAICHRLHRQEPTRQLVAQEQNGLYGGLFVNRAQAVKYALFENGHHPETIVELAREIELDMTGGQPIPTYGRRPEMTMLTHPGDRLEPASRRPGRRDTAVPPAAMDLGTASLFLRRALGLPLMASAVGGIIGLKAAVFLSRLSL